MNVAIIDVNYLDTWDQEGEDGLEDGGEDAEDPAELPEVTKEEHLALTAAYLPLHCSGPSIFHISGM